jgi:O-antigen ligase
VRNARTIFLILVGGSVAALATLMVSPALSKNMVFVAALPPAALVFILLILNLNTTFKFLLGTRCLLDPALGYTKVGGGIGIGGLLNLFVIVVAAALAFRFPKPVTRNRYLFPWIAFLLVTTLMVFPAPSPIKGIRILMSYITYLCMFAVPFILVRSENDKKFWVKLLLTSSFAPVLCALAGMASRKFFLDPFGRLQGTFTHPNILAFYLVFVAALVFYVLKVPVLRLTSVKRGLLWLYLAMTLAALIGTQTRSAWIAAAFFFLGYGLLKDRKFLFICVLGGVMLFPLPPIQERFQDLASGTGARRSEQLNSWAWRVGLWKDAIPLIKQKPVLGHGLDSFLPSSAEFAKVQKGGQGAPAHNVYVQILFDMGFAGLFAYVWIYARILKTFFFRMKTPRAGPPHASNEAAVLFCYVLCTMLVGVSDNVLDYLAFQWYFWFFAGLMISSSQLSPSDSSRLSAQASN